MVLIGLLDNQAQYLQHVAFLFRLKYLLENNFLELLRSLSRSLQFSNQGNSLSLSDHSIIAELEQCVEQFTLENLVLLLELLHGHWLETHTAILVCLLAD